MPVAKKKSSEPTLLEQAQTLVEEAEALDDHADILLDQLAEKYRHSNIPAGALRQLWMARAGGQNWLALRVALKQIPQG